MVIKRILTVRHIATSKLFITTLYKHIIVASYVYVKVREITIASWLVTVYVAINNAITSYVPYM